MDLAWPWRTQDGATGGEPGAAPDRRTDPAPPLRRLGRRGALAGLLERPLAVVYKHSPRCWQSSATIREVTGFADRYPDVPVFLVDVVGERELARRIAESTGVRHESPQLLVLREGEAVWETSHFGVQEDSLVEALKALADETERGEPT